MAIKQSKANYKSKEIPKDSDWILKSFCDRRLEHVFRWLRNKRLDKKKALSYNGNKGGKMIKAKQITISVRCSKSLYDRIKLLSDRLDTSKGEIMRRALDAYLKLLKVAEKKVKAERGKD